MNNQVFVQSVKGGISLPDDDNEYFAISLVKNAEKASQFTFPQNCAVMLYIVGMNLKGEKDLDFFDTGIAVEIPRYFKYSPASIAVGDFTGAGVSDQIALVTTENTGIVVSVYKLKKEYDVEHSEDKYFLEEIVKQDVLHSWHYPIGGVVNNFTWYPLA